MPSKLAIRGAVIFGLMFLIFIYFLLFVNQKNSKINRRQYINTQYVTQPITESSQAILVGNTLYISAQIGLKENRLIDATIYSETEQTMNNIEFLLHKANMKFENVVKYTIYLKDMDNLEIVSKIIKRYFTKVHPAVDVLEVTQLPHNANVQISCIAIE
ncbi:MAG: RidA family protein [Microscillaceae bacterium]|nr:RidA family protein [Microscillaceae bacterium]MDW8460708.1 RidA family protein [Cytophagales bacterium]